MSPEVTGQDIAQNSLCALITELHDYYFTILFIQGILKFPESVENCLRPLDDAIINGIQLFLNPFTLILAQIVSGKCMCGYMYTFMSSMYVLSYT